MSSNTVTKTTENNAQKGEGMKFIHAADIHLDSPLVGLSNYQDAPAEQLRKASRDALSALVDKALEEEVDFVVVAGDVYDGDWRDHNTGIFFGQEMGRLRKAKIPVFMLWGNHDAESEMTKKLTLPDNVTVFSSRKPEVHIIEHLKVALHGQSFKDKATVDNLAQVYKPPVSGYYNIGVLHTGLEGGTRHAHYAPCSRAELDAKGYDYWALGHVHEFQQWTDRSVIVFPGNLQGRHIRETGRRGAVLVTVDGGETKVERLFIDVLRWEEVTVDVSECTSLPELARTVGLALESLLDTDSHVPRAARVTLVGKTPAHGLFFGSANELRAEVLNQIGIIGNDRVWLEKLRVQTTPPDSQRRQSENSEALAELQEILASAASDAEFIAQLKRGLQPFVSKVVSEVNEEAPLLAKARAGELAALIDHVSPALMARLAQGE